MKKKPVDAIDVQIINCLQTNANITNKALAKEIGLSPGPTLVRVQNLWKRRILTNYKADINLSYFKFNHKALLILTLNPSESEDLENRITDCREVIYVARLKQKKFTSTYRYAMLLMVKSEEHLQDLIVKLTRDLAIYDINSIEIDNIVQDRPLMITHEEV